MATRRKATTTVTANAAAAIKIRELRLAAGLSQRALADRVGTTASVICRLEKVDYSGHTLQMLDRVATAVAHKVTIQFVPQESD